MISVSFVFGSGTGSTDPKDYYVVEEQELTKTVKLQSTYNEYLDELRIIIYYKSENFLDEGVLENYCQEYICTFIEKEEHRYYDYRIVLRKQFYKKMFKKDYYNTYEMRVILK